LIYLIIFGSVIAFTAFVVALKTLPSGIVMTYAYVNPVIALLLGWIVLDEKITFLTISGTILILLGVTGIFKERYGKKAGNV
jgi:drug/metabolite transporter (DMT)-like permease